MTVAQMITELQKLDPKLPVLCDIHRNSLYMINSLELAEHNAGSDAQYKPIIKQFVKLKAS